MKQIIHTFSRLMSLSLSLMALVVLFLFMYTIVGHRLFGKKYYTNLRTYIYVHNRDLCCIV